MPDHPAPPGTLRAALERSLGTDYAVVRELGGGGMSHVFLAEDRRRHRHVVVKVPSTALTAGRSAERFGHEIQVAAALDDPHIVPVLGAGSIDGDVPYYVMPYVAGESLRARLAAGPVPIGEAVSILCDVAVALAYAHAHGIVHRDVKPDHVLLAGRTAVVTDFGIATALIAAQTRDAQTRDAQTRDAQTRDAQTRDAQTRDAQGRDAQGRDAQGRDAQDDAAPGHTIAPTSASVGTPGYMAPEQIAGDAVDRRADLYAWGVIAYEMLAGGHPFATKQSAQQLLAAHLAQPPVPLGARAPAVPATLAALVMRCLEKSPSARPESADALVAALNEVRAGIPTERPTSVPMAAPPPVEQRSRRTRVILAIGSMAGLAALVALVLLWQRLAERARAAGPRAIAEVATVATGTAVPTVAVLPFANLGHDPANDYVGDGIADELAHTLARLPELRVAGRASSYAYRETPAPAPEIGRTLGVAGVIDGSVRRAGGRLRVTARLTSALDDTVLWNGAYESASSDLFAIQDSLTRAIVAAMLPTLPTLPTLRGAPSDPVPNADRGTRDAPAYDLYLKGRYDARQRGTANLARAIDHFRQAVARDARFARAYAGLALAYGALAPRDSTIRLTTTNARRAAALDASLADAPLALGLARAHELQLTDAERYYRAAIALDPSSVAAHQWLGETLTIRGRTDAGIDELETARRLDPLAAGPARALGTARLFARQFAASQTLMVAATARDTTSTTSRHTLALAQLFDGHADSAARTLAAALRRDPATPGARGALVLAYAADSQWADAGRTRSALRRGSIERAFADLVFGDREPLVRLLGTPDGRLAWHRALGSFGCNPLLDPLWTDARFVASMAEIGVPRCELARPWPIGAPPRR